MYSFDGFLTTAMFNLVTFAVCFSLLWFSLWFVLVSGAILFFYGLVGEFLFRIADWVTRGISYVERSVFLNARIGDYRGQWWFESLIQQNPQNRRQ